MLYAALIYMTMGLILGGADLAPSAAAVVARAVGWALFLIGAGLLAAQVATGNVPPIEGPFPDTGAPPSGASLWAALRERVMRLAVPGRSVTHPSRGPLHRSPRRSPS